MDCGCCPRWWVSVGYVAVEWCGAVEEARCDGSSEGGEDDGRRPEVAGLVNARKEMADGGKAGWRRAGVCGAARRRWIKCLMVAREDVDGCCRRPDRAASVEIVIVMPAAGSPWCVESQICRRRAPSVGRSWRRWSGGRWRSPSGVLVGGMGCKIEGSESSGCLRHFGRIRSANRMSRGSLPPAAMAAGLGEGDGALYWCSSGALQTVYLQCVICNLGLE
ncbi:hypothetical protein ACLOJK_029269 [Asimina triloba]